MNRWFNVRNLLRRRRIEADMAEEMRLHLDQRVAEYVAEGLSPEEARFAALRRFGGVEQAKEVARAQRSWFWLEESLRDARYALRQLRRSPVFAVTVVAIVALGIGATTTMFSVANALLLRPLRYEQPGQLVRIFEAAEPGGENVVSPGVFSDWCEQAASFEGFAAFSSVALNFENGPKPDRINGWRMSASGLRLLRARPILGRTFNPDEEPRGHDHVMVLSYELWQGRFGGDREVLGHSVSINGDAYTIIGVLPPRFLPDPTLQFVVPLQVPPADHDKRDRHYLSVLARLRPGVSLKSARAELAGIGERNKALYPSWKKSWTVTLVPMREELVEQIKPTLVVLLAAVSVVLLIGCTNVANLLLARASARCREISLRSALGASRLRIARQMLVESLVLAFLGGAVGVLLALWSVAGLREVFSAMHVPRAEELALEPRMLLFTLVLSGVTGLGFGLAPALHAARTDLGDPLKDAARGSDSRGGQLRGSLIVAQVALALVLLVGAGLLLRSFVRIVNVPTGFTPEHALTMQLTLSPTRYPGMARQVAFYNRAVAEIQALPGVEAAGFNTRLPLAGGWSDRFFRVVGRAHQPDPGYDLDYDYCTADFGRALGIPLVYGRWFTIGEVASNAPVAVINQEVKRRLFPNENPIGQHLSDGDSVAEIVGVVADIHTHSLIRAPSPIVYRPGAANDQWRSSNLVVRTRGDPAAMAETIRHAIELVDPAQPVANVRTLADVVAASVGDRRLTVLVVVAFATVAIVLAAIGLYGVIAYDTTQRMREFGIRVALGSSRGRLVSLVLRKGLQLVAIGVGLGLAGSSLLSRLLTALLYETEPTDPLIFASVCVLLLAAGLVAAVLPALHAGRVDPVVALRAE